MRRSILPRFLVSALAGLLLAAPAVYAAEPSGVAIIVARGTPVADMDRHELALI